MTLEGLKDFVYTTSDLVNFVASSKIFTQILSK